MDLFSKLTPQDAVLVVGAGIMGIGVAQTAAQAGHAVFLFDMRPSAAQEAHTRLAETLEALVVKGKLTAAVAQETLARIRPVAALEQATSARLAVEAIVERLEAKQDLFQQLESMLPNDAILATNTSSISVTAIGKGMKHPERLVGMHFFNPVPVMRLVEVVTGLQTSPAVAEGIFELSQAWGKVPVFAKNTPGFIVNRIARPFYAETLALLQERASSPEILDACLRSASFRMGPCELMDLIGHDTNFSVTQSVYEANFFDKRFTPSLIQRELVDGGLLGRKSGRGFYVYPKEARPSEALSFEPVQRPSQVSVHGSNQLADMLHRSATTALAAFGIEPLRSTSEDWTGIQVDDARLFLTDGRPAYEIASVTGSPDVAVFDRPLPGNSSPEVATLAFALNGEARQTWQSQAPAWLKALGFEPVQIADTPGLVVARTIAMLVNEAADAVQQGVCTPEGADTAMRLGVNYPGGPFEWLNNWSAQGVARVLDALDAVYRGERYRVSPWLRRAAARELV